MQIKFPEREDPQGKKPHADSTSTQSEHQHAVISYICVCLAPQAEAHVQENGETNGDVKDSSDPATPKKCDVIILSGRKERCEAAVEALKVWLEGFVGFYCLAF